MLKGIWQICSNLYILCRELQLPSPQNRGAGAVTGFWKGGGGSG